MRSLDVIAATDYEELTYENALRVYYPTMKSHTKAQRSYTAADRHFLLFVFDAHRVLMASDRSNTC